MRPQPAHTRRPQSSNVSRIRFISFVASSRIRTWWRSSLDSNAPIGFLGDVPPHIWRHDVFRKAHNVFHGFFVFSSISHMTVAARACMDSFSPASSQKIVLPISATSSALFHVKFRLVGNPWGQPFSRSCESQGLFCDDSQEAKRCLSGVVVEYCNEPILQSVDTALCFCLNNLMCMRRSGTDDIFD